MIAVVQDIPLSYALTVGARAPTVSFRVLTVTGPIRYGAMIAFFAATLPLHFAGMPMAFWALLAGVAGVGVFESKQLLQCWRPKQEVAYSHA
ncbi:MAG: hypothetical protein MK118_08865 [Dehalococcoidia bacterium]|nr:hypothetical protein [Dehalococcoidia bacterium]